jgi:hypothetical protein
VQQISLFARHFSKSPEVLGPEEICSYQLYLTNEKKLALSSILIAVSALRFLYKVTLHREWCLKDIIPASKRPQKLPIVLSPQEVLQLLSCVQSIKRRTILTVLCRWTKHLGGCPSESRPISTAKDGHPSGTGQRAERSICHALPKAIGSPTRLMAGGQAQAVALSPLDLLPQPVHSWIRSN